MSTEQRDTVFIGKKPIMAYVTSTLIQLANLPSVNIKARGMSFHRAAQLRLSQEVVLDRDQGQLLEGIGRRFLPLKDLLQEMPNPSSPHWLEVAQDLVDRTFLFSPHPPA